MENSELLPLQMECMMLFQSNPYMIESIDGLEIRLGRWKKDIQPILETLLKQGIIEQIGDADPPLYRYKEPIIITGMEVPDTMESP